MVKQDSSILILNGSPRKNGNTAKVLVPFKKALENKFNRIEEVRLYDLDFKGCAHCDGCKKVQDRPGCVLKDDLTPLLDVILKRDILVFASPIYCWSVSGSMSSALDRFYAFFKHNQTGMVSLLRGKKIVGLFTSGGDYFDGMQLAVAMLKELCAFGGATYVGTVSAVHCMNEKFALPTPETLTGIINNL